MQIATHQFEGVSFKLFGEIYFKLSKFIASAPEGVY